MLGAMAVLQFVCCCTNKQISVDCRLQLLMPIRTFMFVDISLSEVEEKIYVLTSNKFFVVVI